jgi:phospholipid-binding lipoprotein MlaA
MTASAWTVAAENSDNNPDPWEPVNRKIFAFNDFLDRYFLKPVAKGYETITPQFVEDGVHHMYSNVGEVGNILNSLLQAKFKNTAESGGRLVVNSTIGLLGFFDVASKMGLQQHEEDFGQTLGYWGVHAGPYIVVPFLGSRTLRDGFGSVADAYSDPIPYAIDYVPTRNEILGGRVIDTRAQLLKAEELISGDRYIFIRDAYLQRRQFLIDDGAVKDTFGDDDFMNDDEGAESKPADQSAPEKAQEQEPAQPEPN